MRKAPIVMTALLLAAPATGARAESLPVRTAAVSVGLDGATGGGASTRPAISASGDLVAFDSVAGGLTADSTGGVRQVFARWLPKGAVWRMAPVSQGPGGVPGDGPSSHAAVGGGRVVFESDAANLVAGDTNGVRDVFARKGRTPVTRVSVASDGGQADGPSGEADVSADGRFVVFASSATNLVPGDVNGLADVFVRDLRERTTRRVSETVFGEAGNSASSAPGISPDGRFVTFASAASNLDDGAADGVPDVYLADLQSRQIERVSVSSRDRQQDAAVIDPFSQVSDVSRGGRYVAFESDATNLVAGDRNRARDVFVRDRARGVTARVSVDKFGREGDGGSFAPSLSPDGRFVAFASLATDLAEGDGPKADAFVYDRRRGAPVVASVGAAGQARGPELRRQTPQRPRVTADGRLVAFTSTARNLVAGDRNEAEDVFLRVTNPARARIVRGPRGTIRGGRPLLRLSADDPQVRDFLCTLNGVRIRCDRRTRLPRLGPGRYRLEVRAGGPGMLFDGRPRVLNYRVR